MRIPALLALAAWPLAAQFSDLATDDTGSQVWFSTPLILRATGQGSFFGNIFSADMQGNVALVPGAYSQGNYGLVNPEVSGDGRVLVYTGNLNCDYLTYGVCNMFFLDPLGVISTSAAETDSEGIFHLSRNGRYVMHESYGYFGPTEQIELIDLVTMQSVQIPVGQFQSLAGGGRQVAADGSALAYAEGSLWLFQPDGTPLFVTGALSSQQPFSARAAVNDAGDLVVYQVYSPYCLIELSTPSAGPGAGAGVLLGSGASCTLESMSADGSAVLIISSDNFDGSNPRGLSQAWIVDIASDSPKAVTHDLGGVSAATLSNDGNVVWAATFGGRMLRIDLSTGATQEIIPQTVALDQPWQWEQLSPTLEIEPLSGAPGMLIHVTGSGLASGFATSTVPLNTTLGGAQVLVDGQPAPLLSVSPTDIVVQIPWETNTGTHSLGIPDTASLFEGALSRSLGVYESLIQFWPDTDGSKSVIHQDFSGPVTEQSPARPGEIIHLYATGLGAVTPPVANGQPGPLNPLSVMENPVSVAWCADNYTPETTGTLFAGLAPGLAGIEQVDVQVPGTLPAPAPGLTLTQVSVSIWAQAQPPVSLGRSCPGTTVLVQR